MQCMMAHASPFTPASIPAVTVGMLSMGQRMECKHCGESAKSKTEFYKKLNGLRVLIRKYEERCTLCTLYSVRSRCATSGRLRHSGDKTRGREQCPLIARVQTGYASLLMSHSRGQLLLLPLLPFLPFPPSRQPFIAVGVGISTDCWFESSRTNPFIVGSCRRLF